MNNLNWFVVEAENDWIFLKAVAHHLNLGLENSTRNSIYLAGYEKMDGLAPNKLEIALTNLKNNLSKKTVEKIGIVLDNDGKHDDRINQINDAILNVFGENVGFKNSGDSAQITISIDPDDTFNITISCFLMGVNNAGELETVLKTIHTQESVYADCLKSWRECIRQAGKEMSDKEFDKLWVNNYLRYDTCTKEERENAGKYCSMAKFGYIMDNKHEIWDFEHDCLSELRAFLKTFIR